MITRQQALEYFQNDDLIALGMAADQVRQQFHPEGLVSYSTEPINGSAAELNFQAGESLEKIVSRLDAFRQGADGIVAVMPVSEGTAVEYLKIVALTRLLLDNVLHVQTSARVGLKLGQVALRFGANDINGAEPGEIRATEQRGSQAALGSSEDAVAKPLRRALPASNEEDLRRIIRDAGFVPKQRDPQFQTYYLS